MSVKKQTDVLIDQNRNTIHASWMHRDSPDYIKQCEIISHVTHQNAECTFKGPLVNSLPMNAGDNDGQMLSRLKEHPAGNTVNENVCPNNLPSSSTDRQNGDVDTEEDDRDRDESVSKEMLQRRVCLVKLYAWIKEEMSKSAAKSIASHLYQSEHRLLSRLDHESILHCSWRRDAVEQLMKKVLMGPEDIYEVFIRALKDQEEKHIAEKLMKETATESEISVFMKLEDSSLGECQRPDIHEQRLSFTKSDHQTLLYYLNNKNVIDSVNDNLLSRFIFSIREHTNVVHCSLDCEKRVRQLIDTMKKCAEKIFKDFCEILNSIEMSHVIGKLEKRSQGAVTCRQRQKRKPSSTQGTDPEAESSTSAKLLKSSVECRLVSSMQRSSSVLNLQANDQLGFSVEKINNGSIVIQLCPKEPDSWNRLEENCRTGKIKDFIPVVYNNAAVYELLEDGEYRLKFTIYTLPTQPDKQEEKKVMFHLETEEEAPKDIKEKDKVSTSQHDNPIEECLDLLCEELEINKELLTLLKEKGLVEKSIKEEIDKQGSRAKKNKFLLKKIGIHGQKGYEILKEYLREENEDLYQALVTREEVKNIDNKMDTAATVTKKRPSSGGHRGVYKKEVFFTGTVVLVVKKKVMSKKTESKSLSEIEITCPEIIDPVCHFAAKGKEKQLKSGEVTMVLEDAWNLVGANKPPKREILIGKRKQSKDQASKSKRVHTTTDSDDSEVEDAPCQEEEDQDTDLKEKASPKERNRKEALEKEKDSCEKKSPKKEEKDNKQ